ncbi:hypothetical protein FSP39_003265 [Pinctada imbricata]|uniref:DUF6589 domain-containing protein n=1 Tax=Pinctada imbricata TaxID=66713 RepID=A0AA88YKA9_PINIB|nr:hypothetical protein FSP39_003265 [Pinctada imbricata]
MSLVLGGDGRSDSPGHCAKYGSYAVLDLRVMLVVEVQVVQSNEVKVSCHMEKEGLRRCVDTITSHDLSIETLVTDRHVQIGKWVRENMPDTVHNYDVWHVAKGVKKKLISLAREKDCHEIQDWIQSISNHLYWSAASSQDGNGQLILQKWQSVANHVMNIHEHRGDLFPECAHETLEGRERQKPWLKQGSKVADKFEEIVFSRQLEKDIPKLSPGAQTSSLEGFHSVINHFAPKMYHFSYQGMQSRILLAAMHYNENGMREQATVQHTDADIHIDMESYMSVLRKPPMVSSEKQLNNMYTQIRQMCAPRLLSVLNKIHITLSNNTKAKLLNSFSNEWDSELIKTMDNKSRDYHFFASNWVADPVNLTPIPDDHAIGKFEDVSVESFIPNDQEIKLFRNILPKHIPHEHQDEMSEKSSIHLLAIMLKNEAKYDDCVDIMDSYVKHIRDIYSKAGRGGDLDQLLVPIGGGQLTRVRLQGAKSLMQGAHDPQERFDMLSPCIIELFHTMQDFVEAHDQFVTAVGTAYILSLCMKLFGMKNLSDEPQASENFPGNAANLHHENKEKVFRFICDQIIDASFIPPLRLEMLKEQANEIFVAVSINGTKTVLKVPVVNDQITLSVQACGVNMRVSSQQIKKGVTVNLPEYSFNIKEEKPLDQLNCFAINYLNWYYVLLVFKDVIAEGNLEMTNIVLIFLIPLFYSHYKYSKYMVECIDFILKTEYLLTPRMSLKVRAGAFINVTGQSGKNKAADMHKENEVKQIKQAIKSLGANKTEKSIVKISKSNPVIERISENLCCMLDIQSCKTTHKSRSEDVDISTLVDQLMQNDVWNLSHGRQLASFPNMSKSPYTFDFDSFKDCCMNTAQRLRRGVMLRDEESESQSDLED